MLNMVVVGSASSIRGTSRDMMMVAEGTIASIRPLHPSMCGLVKHGLKHDKG